MLILSRKQNEKIRIGDDIVITVVRSGKRVRIGIEAPEHVRILRQELVDRQFVRSNRPIVWTG